MRRLWLLLALLSAAGIASADTPPARVINAELYDSSGNPIGSSGGSLNVQTTSAALPTNAATAANQATGNASLSDIDSKLTTTGNGLKVDVQASVLPSGGSTSALQTTGNTSLNSIDTKMSTFNLNTSGTENDQGVSLRFAASGGSVAAGTSSYPMRIDPTGTTTQPVAVTTSVLPTGAATETTLSTLNTKFSDNISGAILTDGSATTQPISASALPLPLGASTSSNQTSEITQLTDINTALAGTLTVNGSGFNQPVLLKDSAGNGVTSQASGGQRPLDTETLVAGAVVDPRQIRALTTSTDSVNVGNVSGTVSLPTGASTATNQVTIIGDLTTISGQLPSGGFTSQTSGSQKAADVGIDVAGVQVDPRTRTWDLSNSTDSVTSYEGGTWTVQQGGAPWSVSQSGAWTTGRTWTLGSGTDSIKAQLQDNAGTGITSTLIDGTHQAVDVNAVGVTTATVGDLMASGSITTTCSTPTTSCPAGSTVAGSINGVASARLQVLGTFTGASLAVYGTVDGSNWLILETAVGPAGAYTTNPITATGEYRLFRIAGFTQLRVVATALASGTVNIIFNSSIGDNLVESVQQNPANFIATAWLNDGSGNAISSTSGSLNVDVTNSTLAVTQSTSPWVDNITQFGGSNVATGTGAGGAGIPRVTVSNDSNVLSTQSGAWTTGRTWNLSNSTDSVAAAQQGTWTVQQGSGPWTQNLTQVGGTNISTGTGASGAGIPRVTVSNDSNVLATESGTWTVQPGNTANTTPWLATINQGGNSATVTGANALKVDGSAVTQPTSRADSTTTGTLTASAQNIAVSTQGMAAINIVLTGTWSGTIAFQGEADNTGTNWQPVTFYSFGSGGQYTTVTGNGTFTAPTGGWQQIRVLSSGWGSGTANVSMDAGAGVQALYAQQASTWMVRAQDSAGNSLNSTSGSLNVDVTNATLAVTESGGPWTQNLTQVGGTNVSTGTGASGAGIPRVTVANDSNILATQSGAWTTGRTWTLGSGSDSVSSVESGTWSTRTQDGAGNNLTSQASSGQRALDVGIDVAGVQVDPRTRSWTLASGTDSVTAVESGTWVQNLTQVGGTNVSTGTGASGAGIPRVTVANDSNILATQSGTWTVQEGSGPWTQNLTQVGGTTFALGQAAAAGSLPVVTQSDVAPATQNITVQDTGSTTAAQSNSQNFITGTPTAGSAASFTLASMRTVTVEVTGTWTGTVQTEVSTDGGTTWITRGLKQGSYLSSSFTGNVIGDMNVTTMTNVRVRAVAAMTGTATVKITESVNESTVVVSNPLTLRDATVQSISNTIKAASTAAVATDTALVVAVSPNNTVAVTQSTSPWVVGGNLASGATDSGNPVKVGGVYHATPISLSDGQRGDLQLTNSGEVVVAYVDDLNSPQNITTQDLVTTSTTGANGQLIYSGTPTAGSVVADSLTSDGGATVQVTGTWTGTVQVEVSMDGGTTWFARPVHQTGTNYTQAAFTANFTGGFNIAGYTNLRVRATAAMTGTAVVRINTTNNVSTVYVGGAVQSEDNSGNIFGPALTSGGINFAPVYAVGNVASGAADSGNGVKISGVYNSTLPSLSNGNRADLQTDSKARLITAAEGATGSAVPASASLTGGTDGTNLQAIGVQTATTNSPSSSYFIQTVPMTYSYKNLAGAATTTVKSGAGTLHEFCVNNNDVTATATVYDNTSATAPIIATITNTVGGGAMQSAGCMLHDIAFATGLTVVTTGTTANYTAAYK